MSLLSRLGGRSADPPPLPYEPRSPEGLAARWVQWVAAAAFMKNPLDDPTGEFAAANQPDDVWFLAGSYGEAVERRCIVPAGRDLFMPLVNTWNRNPQEPLPPFDRAFGAVVVDGVSMEGDPITTGQPFLVAGSRMNAVTMRTKPVPVTVAGLWKLIPGLAPGEHHLRAVGGDGYGFTVDVTYHLVATSPLAWPSGG